MIVRVEFPGSDIIEESEESRILQGQDGDFYIVTDDFFIWISSAEEMAKAMVDFK